RRAHAVIINKVNSAKAGDIETVRANTRSLNPQAVIIETASVIEVHGDAVIKGKKVLVIEDGPTLTHGGMAFGAGIAAARMHGAIPVDVRPYAVGSIKETLLKYPHLQNCLPAMGYSKGQIRELQETIERTPCDAVLAATPVNLHDALGIKRPCVRVSYEVRDIDGHGLEKAVEGFLKRLG
ncbi:MAG: GTPase, partial [Deltaproteobacteria bacterium]|nr:GTPase [Deltaproteobacteria bacterium]